MFIIAGLYRRLRLLSPKGDQTRPTASRLREALFNICQHSIEGAAFLDLFAGSGAMGLEALSRGAAEVTFVDRHKEAIRCIQQNITHLNVQKQCRVIPGDVFSALKKLEEEGRHFDIIYADPPYRTPVPGGSGAIYSTHLIEWIDQHPILKPEGVLFIEEDFDMQPQLDTLRSLHLQDSRRMGGSVLQRYVRGRLL